MLSPRLSECLQCSDISSLIAEIDCKLADLANSEYNNVVFALNRPIQDVPIGDLINYRRILLHRICNPDYGCDFSVNAIGSRVKILVNR